MSEIPHILRGIIARHPRDADRAQLERLAEFTEFAAQNLGVARDVLSTVSQPIQINTTNLQGGRTPLDAYAVVVAVSISLMFVCVLLAAGGIALEREEHTLARLVRSSPSSPNPSSAATPTTSRRRGALITREALIAQKLLLAAGCALVVAFAMLAGIGAFVGLEWSRVGQWLAALAIGGLAFAALGVAIGALAREVRAASLLSFLLLAAARLPRARARRVPWRAGCTT